MADISNLKINERANVESPNLRIGKITSGAECRLDTIPKFSNFWNFDSFPNFKNSESLLIFQVVKFLK